MDHSQRSAIGDWSGIKGTHYHLVYTLHLLVRQRLPRVWFYAGNDLKAEPVRVPKPTSSVTRVVASGRDDADLWVQLKSTSVPWTRTNVIQELLLNFGLNALASEAQGQDWRCELVSPGPIRTSAIRSFLKDPSFHPALKKSFEKVVRVIVATWNSSASKDHTADTARVSAICRDVMEQIASCSVKSLEELKAELLLELTGQHGSEQSAEDLAVKLLGALLEDGSEAPGARAFDEEWLDAVAGFSVLPKGVFDLSVARACDHQVERALARLPEWDPTTCIARHHLLADLDRFLSASEPVYVLSASTDAGKTWALAQFAAVRLADTPRVWATGDDLADVNSLAALIHSELASMSQSTRTPDELLSAWLAETVEQGTMPIVIIDNIGPSSQQDMQRYQGALSRLAYDAQEHGVRLVLSVNEAVLHGYKPTAGVGAELIFAADSSEAQASYSLSGPDRSELIELANSLTSGTRARQIAAELEQRERLASASMRVASHLIAALASGRYLAALGHGTRAILEDALDERIRGIETRLPLVGTEEVGEFVQTAVTAVWQAGGQGLPRLDLANLLGERGVEQPRLAVLEMQREGLIGSGAPVRFVDSGLTALVVGNWIGQRDGLDWLDAVNNGASLEPVAHWVRDGTQFSATTAHQMIAVAPALAEPICRGIALRPTVSVQEAALLIGWTRRDPRLIAYPPACEALGQIVDRSDLARRWIPRTFVCGDATDRIRGEIALGCAFAVDAEWCAEQVRTRLSDSHVENMKTDDKAKWLRGALSPLRVAPTNTDPDVMAQLMAEASRFESEVPGVLADIRARWHAAPPGQLLADLADRLRSGGVSEREQAARVVFELAKDYPRPILDIVQSMAPHEQADHVLMHLMRALHHTAHYPQETLDCLTHSRALELPEFPGSGGTTLAVLAQLAPAAPDEVVDVLPRELSDVHPNWAAQLLEVLTHAWWRCAEQRPDEAAVLQSLTDYEGLGMDDEFRPIAARGASIAQLALCCLHREECPTENLVGLYYYNTDVSPGMSTHLHEFLDEHAEAVVHCPDFEEVTRAHLRAIAEYEEHKLHPIHRQWANVQFSCARSCVEELALLAAASDDPVSLLQQIPGDWEPALATRTLLERGDVSPELLSHARTLEELECRSMNGREEISLLMADLAALSGEPAEAYEQGRKSTGDPFMGPEHDAALLSKLMDTRPEWTIRLLEAQLTGPRDLAALREWCHRPTDWRVYLVASAIERVLDASPISCDEAAELCDQLVLALGDCGSTEVEVEWTRVYEAPQAALSGEAPKFPIEERGDSHWNRSHRFATEVLERAQSGEPTDWVEWLGVRCAARLEDPNHGVNETGGVALMIGDHLPLTFVLPAVRFALIAAAGGRADPVAEWSARRALVFETAHEYRYALDPRLTGQTHDRTRIDAAINALEPLLEEAWWDCRLLDSLAIAYLTTGEPQKALDVLEHAEKLRDVPDHTSRTSEYNRACAYAQLGDDEHAEASLRNVIVLGWNDFGWLRQDPDFEGVRDRQWFSDLLAEHEENGQTGA